MGESQELDKDTNSPPILISLFKIFGTRLDSKNIEESMLRPYLRVVSPLLSSS